VSASAAAGLLSLRLTSSEAEQQKDGTEGSEGDSESESGCNDCNCTPIRPAPSSSHMGKEVSSSSPSEDSEGCTTSATLFPSVDSASEDFESAEGEQCDDDGHNEAWYAPSCS
jgi:hypothetical protein